MSLLSPLLFLAAAPFSGPFLALSLSLLRRASLWRRRSKGGGVVSALGAGARRPGRARTRPQGSDFLPDHSGLVE